jgi:hypothetical protein
MSQTSYQAAPLCNGAQQGIRTLTNLVLSEMPLPIGLIEQYLREKRHLRFGSCYDKMQQMTTQRKLVDPAGIEPAIFSVQVRRITINALSPFTLFTVY